MGEHVVRRDGWMDGRSMGVVYSCLLGWDGMGWEDRKERGLEGDVNGMGKGGMERRAIDR
jgi:hypothetical protein